MSKAERKDHGPPANARPTDTTATRTTRPITPAPMPTAAFELITPALAEVMLNGNANNRRLRDTRVTRFASRIRAGLWRVTHQGVAVGSDGLLYDGQHRLRAIIESGVPTMLLVVRGLDPTAREVIDIGEKRSAADNLSIVDGHPIGTADAAIANALRLMLFNDGTGPRPCEAHEMRDILSRFSAGIAAVKRAMPATRKSITRAPVMAALAFAHAAAPSKIEKMAAQIYDGHDLSAGDPILAVRNALLSTDRKPTAAAHFKRCLLAIDARLRGRAIARSVSTDTPLREMRCYARFARANSLDEVTR